jgi:hypothetical protein
MREEGREVKREGSKEAKKQRSSVVHLKIGRLGWEGKSGSFAPALKKKHRGFWLGAGRRMLKIDDEYYCWGGGSELGG